ncbi:MAG: PASTA domain-containing protein [Bacteroidaceae bacterium]|nr:PASTA domain-containing protein [Bacteroidaceae bacterium]
MGAKKFFKSIFNWVVWLNIAGMILLVILVIVGAWQLMAVYTHHGEVVAVPNVRGMMESDARYTLTREGLTPIVIDSAYNQQLPPGAVIDQDPHGGREVKEGREIYLTVNAQNKPTLPIPDIADNSSLRDAQQRLLGMGFRLGPIEYVYGEKDWVYGVKVRGRNVYSGERVPIDVPLVLQVGKGDENPEDEEQDADDWSNGAEQSYGIDDLGQ